MTNVEKTIRLSKLAREFNVGISTLVDFLGKKGHKIESNPNTKVDANLYQFLAKEYGAEMNLKKESQKVSLSNFRDKKESVSIDDIEGASPAGDDIEPVDDEVVVKNVAPEVEMYKTEKPQIKLKVKGKIDLSGEDKAKTPEDTKPVEPQKEVEKEPEQPKKKEEPIIEHIKTETQRLEQPKVLGKVDVSETGKRKPTKKEKPVQKPQDAKPKVKTTTPEKATEKPLDSKQAQPAQPAPKPDVENQDETPKKPQEKELYRSEVEKLSGPTVVGKIDLTAMEPKKKAPGAPGAAGPNADAKAKKKRRKRIRKDVNQKVAVVPSDKKPGITPKKNVPAGGGTTIRKKNKKILHKEVSEEDVQKQIKETLARLTSKGGRSKGAKYRREKRDLMGVRQQQEMEREIEEQQTLKVTEFVSANELANMIDVSPTKVIEVCMNLGLMVSINQRLDAETMALVADEFGYKVEFVSIDLQEAIGVEEDKPEDLLPRAPIITVMGHVDHGKTSLLDFVRSANVIGGEAGGITQHIGAYAVVLESGKQITFLDTPGHEAFTAMRARGAKITDVAVIVVAADDNVMPQTIEAINHASAAGVPIVFAINKIDKPSANPEKIKETLAQMNYLVEDWGGKYQSQDISAKTGLNIDKLLDKVLLEAELLELKANPNKKAIGTIIESSLDKGRGFTATVLVEAGTLRQGDIMIAGTHFGRVKAMFNERGKRIDVAGPSTPVQVIGLNGAPLAGDYFNLMDTDKEAKDIANRREQLQRMQGIRSQKHITLDEIGRRIAIGNFQELNIVLKGDVDGSIEALSDSLIDLSTEQIQVKVIHKAVGQISESDILLAAASNAIVIGFQVRPSLSARKIAEKEEIDIRMYSIIYDAINEVKTAMEGMLAPEIKEEILGTAEVLEAFNITKVGTIAGCIVREGKILRNAKCRLIRDGIVLYAGDLGSLKRFKDDAKEIGNGFECGLNIHNFNDIKVGDIIESYQEVEVKRKL